MNYTYLKGMSWLNKELNRLKANTFSEKVCSEHPSYFTHHYLGITPYKYQHLILRRFRNHKNSKFIKNDKFIVCKSRQIGISWCYAFLAIWFAFCNKANTGPFKNTKVGIISRSDKQAVKFMGLVQKLIWNSKMPIDVVKDRKHSLSKTEVHFQNGWIKCFPPTDSCRGETFDLLIVDEAAWVDEDIFRDAMEPTTIAYHGKILLSSTPKGQKGMFFEVFDPRDVRPRHEYKRYWFNWRMCENEVMKKLIRSKERYAKETGNIKSFDQEYNALFTVDQEAFFEDQEVENGVDRNLSKVYEFKDAPCSIGIDYGGVGAATAITVVAKLKTKIILLYQFAEKGFDENLLMDKEWEHSIPNLVKRYMVDHIVVDDCAQGTRTNQQLENEGYPVLRFNFRSDQAAGERNRGYYNFKGELHQGRIQYPELRNLMAEMKALEEIRMKVNTQIKGSGSYNDDLIDSFMMATYPYLQKGGAFSSTVVDYKDIQEKIDKENKNKGPWFDYEWERIKNGGLVE